MSPGDLLILSGATPGFDPDGLAAANHERFAALAGHRQQFVTEGFDPDRPAAWSKLKFLRDVLTGPMPPDWVFWIDADAVFLRPGNLLDFADPAFDLIVGEDASGINTGAVFVRASDWTLAFLARVWSLGSDWRWQHHGWWEQAAIRHLIETDPAVAARIKLVPHRLFNSQPHAGPDAYAEGDLVAHFCGGYPHDKQARVREWAGRLP